MTKYIAPIMDKTPEELSAYLNEVKTAVQEDFNMITKKAETTVS